MHDRLHTPDAVDGNQHPNISKMLQGCASLVRETLSAHAALIVPIFIPLAVGTLLRAAGRVPHQRP